MATQWRYRIGGEEYGPVPSQQLKVLAATGHLSPDDLVWKDGLADWVAARQVQGLFDPEVANSLAAISGPHLGKALDMAARSSSEATPADSTQPVKAAEQTSSPPPLPIPAVETVAVFGASEDNADSMVAIPSVSPTRPGRARRSNRRLVILTTAGAVLVGMTAAIVMTWEQSDSKPVPPLVVDSQWTRGDFLLTGAEAAVLVEGDKEGGFVLNAEAEGEAIEPALAAAAKFGIDIIEPDDANLPSYIAARHNPNETIDESLGGLIADYWPVDRRPWERASFVIADGEQFAVAVKIVADGRYQVAAGANPDLMERAMEIARRAAVPVLQPSDTALAADLYRTIRIATSMEPNLAERIDEFWPFDRSRWKKADFVLLDDAGRAVALDYRHPDAFLVCAAAEGNAAAAACEVAEAARVPLIRNVDVQLVADIYRKCRPDQDLEPSLVTSALNYWPINKAVWKQADFVMVNPTETAVAMKYIAEDQYELLAVADAPHSDHAIQFAWETQMPMIARDPALTRRISSSTALGQRVSAENSARIADYWREYRFVPQVDEFVSFHDVQQAKWCVGYLLDDATETIRYQPLSSTKPVDLPRNRIQPGSLERATGDDELRDLQHIELVDYCALRVASALQSAPGRPTHLHVVVNPVKVDKSAEELATSSVHSVVWRTAVNAFGTRLLGATYRTELRNEPAQILRLFAESLQHATQERLLRLNVPLLERDELDTILRERGRTDAGFDPEQYSNQPLLGPTHIVFSEIRHIYGGGALVPEVHATARRGQFEWSIRVIHVGTGQIVSAFQIQSNGPERSGVKQYLLDSGDLALLDLRERVSDPKPKHGASWAMNLPEIGSNFDPRANAILAPRLGYVERRDGSTVVYRDLFSRAPVELPANQVVIKPVRKENIDEIPQSHQMRFLIWSIARGTLPLAGCVTDVNGSNASVGVGLSQGMKTGDELSVVRFERNQTGLASHRVLNLRPKIADLQQRSSVVFVAAPGEHALKKGDIVMPRFAAPITVAIVPPRLVMLDADLRKRAARWNAAQLGEMSRQATSRATELGNQLTRAMSQLDVPVTDQSVVLTKLAAARAVAGGVWTEREAQELARDLGVSHLVYGELSPTFNYDPGKTSDRVILSLRMIHTDTAHVTVLPAAELLAKQFEDWQP